MKPATVGPTSLCFFWDMQNCAVPSKMSPYECVAKIRAAVVLFKGEKTTEVSFNSYCDVSKLSQDVRQELGRARVIVHDVPSQKPAAADIRLLQDILHHTMTHRAGIIVLVSGDIDFAETVHDLVHTGGYKVILIHNKQARAELCQNASTALRYEDIVGTRSKSKASAPNTTPKKPARQHAAKVWACAECSKTFISQEARQQHADATNHAFEWSCDECSKSFQNERGLEQHLASTGHDQISCSICGAVFGSWHSLSQHLHATGHGDDLSWSCPQCDDDSWDDLSSLLDHLRFEH